jgi:hypothetical protein
VTEAEEPAAALTNRSSPRFRGVMAAAFLGLALTAAHADAQSATTKTRAYQQAQLKLRPAVLRLRGRENVEVSRLLVDSLQVVPVGALEQGGQAFRWRSLQPVRGTWAVTLPAPLLRGIYPLRLRTRAGRRSFRSPRWFLRVFPPGTLSFPSFENPGDVVRWWVRTRPHGTNVSFKRWPLPAWDRRDPRLHRLFVVAYSPPGRPNPADRLGFFVTAFRNGYGARWRFLEAKLLPT